MSETSAKWAQDDDVYGGERGYTIPERQTIHVKVDRAMVEKRLNDLLFPSDDVESRRLKPTPLPSTWSGMMLLQGAADKAMQATHDEINAAMVRRANETIDSIFLRMAASELKANQPIDIMAETRKMLR